MKKEDEPKPTLALVKASFLFVGRSAMANHWTARISFLVLGMNFVKWGTPGMI